MAKYANTYDSTYAPNPVTAKKKKPIPQTGVQGGAMPITGGPTQVVKGSAQGAPGGGAAGTLAPRPTGGTSVWDGGLANTKNAEEWDNPNPALGPVSGKDQIQIQDRPDDSVLGGGGGAQDNWAEDDLLGTSGTDYEDTRNLLYERIQQLMGEGATSTAELEEIIASQYGDVLDQGMGGILAQAGAGGMGLGGGMVGQSQDLARQVATDQSAAVIDARRQAEADLMDRLGVAGGLFGLGLKDMDQENFWAFIKSMYEPPDGGPGAGPGGGVGDGTVDGALGESLDTATDLYTGENNSRQNYGQSVLDHYNPLNSNEDGFSDNDIWSGNIVDDGSDSYEGANGGSERQAGMPDAMYASASEVGGQPPSGVAPPTPGSETVGTFDFGGKTMTVWRDVNGKTYVWGG